ncbi:hypothetical protein MMC34_005644 [Xylographa carneopallida]|nr:hypothetical protein [Xylographa carneopallida]
MADTCTSNGCYAAKPKPKHHPQDVPSISPQTYRFIRCLFFYSLWLSSLLYILLSSNLLRNKNPISPYHLPQPTRGSSFGHENGTISSCEPLLASQLNTAVDNVLWRTVYILTLILSLPLTGGLGLFTVLSDGSKHRHLLQLFFALGLVFGFVIDIAQDSEVRERDYYLVVYLTLNWSLNVAMALALLLSGRWRAIWREACAVQGLQGWLEAGVEGEETWEA